MVCILSAFFSCFLLFLLVFSLTDTNDSWNSWEGRGNYFSFFLLPSANKHSLCSPRSQPLLHFFLLDLLLITRLIADGTSSSLRFTFYLHFYWFSYVGVIGFDISKLHCGHLSSYQTIILLLQNELLNQLILTPLDITVYLS